MSGYTGAWLGWILMFVVIEGSALIRPKRGDTLSEHVWDWFSIRNKAPGYQARRFGLLTFLTWLLAHLMTGGWV